MSNYKPPEHVESLRCSKCLKDKPPDSFHKSKAHKRGRYTICKQCKKKSRCIYTEMYSNAKRRAKDKGWEFDLTVAFLRSLSSEQKGLCALTLIPMDDKPNERAGRQRVCPPNRVSLDRIDSSGGYTQRNVQLVTDLANRIKYYYSMGELVDFCEKVVENRQKVTN